MPVAGFLFAVKFSQYHRFDWIGSRRNRTFSEFTMSSIWREIPEAFHSQNNVQRRVIHTKPPVPSLSVMMLACQDRPYPHRSASSLLALDTALDINFTVAFIPTARYRSGTAAALIVRNKPTLLIFATFLAHFYSIRFLRWAGNCSIIS